MSSMINTNIASLTSQNSLTKSQSALTTSMQRLSSGLRINSAKDDAAGLAISERMTSQIGGLNQATRNSNDGISMTQTAEGALSSISDSLQRIRELAVQSANGSNTDADRASMQAEASQLLSEIDRVSTQTKFNGKTLLDGSLNNQQFQVGANSGETISFSVGSARTSKLGSSDAAAITTAQNAGTTALVEGAFSLNGVMIGPSQAAADTASTAAAAGSSIAKAAAVNAKSAQSGVTATVNATEVAGSSMTAVADTGIVTINNVAINVSTTADAASSRASVISAINASSKQTGVTAVDSGSDKGGVKLTAADGRNIDISFSGFTNNATAAKETGLAAAGTNSGSITLNSDKAIVITSNQNGAAGSGGVKDAGLTVGAYSAQTAYASTTAVAAGATNLTSIVSGDFKINNAQVGSSLASSDTASSYAKVSSGIAKAAAINALSAQTGVTATANTTAVQGGATTAAPMSVGATSGALVINGVRTATITTTATSTTAQNRKATVDAINAISGQTGVIATDSNDDTKGVSLAAADGRNITAVQDTTITDNAVAGTYARTAGTLTAASTGLGFSMAGNDNNDAGTALTGTTALLAAALVANGGLTTGGATATQAAYDEAKAADTTAIAVDAQLVIANGAGTAAVKAAAVAAANALQDSSSAGRNLGTTTSTITLSSTKEFTVDTGTTGNGAKALNLNVGTYGAGRSGDSLDKLNISTVEGANKALTAVDNALKTVNSARSDMGAVQNRFSAVVSNLQSTTENLTASRSRIRDADFATETASLSRGQILQQAGTAMLAQANSLPNGVMALLR